MSSDKTCEGCPYHERWVTTLGNGTSTDFCCLNPGAKVLRQQGDKFHEKPIACSKKPKEARND